MRSIFSENVRNLAKKRKQSLKDIETELGMSKGSLSKLSYHEPGLNTAMKIAEYFGVEIGDLLTAEKPDENKVVCSELKSNAELSELLKNANIKSIKVEYSFTD